MTDERSQADKAINNQRSIVLEDRLFNKDFHALLNDATLSQVYSLLAAPTTLNIDPLGRGPLERISTDDLNSIHEAIVEKSKIYRERVRDLHRTLVSLRRSEEFGTLEGALTAAEMSDAIRYEDQRLKFLFANQHVDRPFIEALARGVAPDQRLLARQALFGLKRHQDGEKIHDLSPQFFMTVYTFPEGFTGVRASNAQTGPYTSLLASSYRFSEDENAIHKSARSQLKRAHELMHGTALKNAHHLEESLRRAVLIDAFRNDIGGIMLFFSGEYDSVMKGIRKGVLGQLQHDDRIVNAFFYDPHQVRNRAEDLSANANDLRTVMVPLALKDVPSIDGALTGSPIEVRVTDYRNHGILEFGPRAHHQHNKERNTGDYISPNGNKVWVDWTDTEKKFLECLDKEFRFPAHQR